MFGRVTVTIVAAFLAVALTISPARAESHSFKVVNKGGHQIDHLYISPIAKKKWGPDQLDADEVLSPGHSITFTINTDCEMDVRVVYHDGNEDVEKDVDTCKYDLSLNY